MSAADAALVKEAAGAGQEQAMDTDMVRRHALSPREALDHSGDELSFLPPSLRVVVLLRNCAHIPKAGD